MKVVAILAIRNEALYLQRCLSHLREQNVEVAIIDNESTDETLEIARQNVGHGVIHLETYPYPGHYDWQGLLRRKEELAGSLGADWYIHHDADEIRQAPAPYADLRTALEVVDASGHNAVDFAEFVFVPTSAEARFEHTDYVRLMRHYYYFQPRPLHRVNAWKNTGNKVDLASSGGHSVFFLGRKIFPAKFVLRHYIILSAEHARQKYGSRLFSRAEVEDLGWHGWRAKGLHGALLLPERWRMKALTKSGEWDTSAPFSEHAFFGEGDDRPSGCNVVGMN